MERAGTRCKDTEGYQQDFIIQLLVDNPSRGCLSPLPNKLFQTFKSLVPHPYPTTGSRCSPDFPHNSCPPETSPCDTYT
jgi:hypothetical protein